MEYYDDFKSDRFKSAAAIGKHADLVFRTECRKRGLDPEQAGISPIDAIANSPVLEVLPMDKEQILDLWSEGLSRPEIIALGAAPFQFQAAIREARAVGDQRAYYRQGRTRLPWQITGTVGVRLKGRIAPIATEMTADAFSASGKARRETMKKPELPFTPKPKRSTGDVGPLLGGPSVDNLVNVFAQIDVAKGELAKRFVMKSDVLRDNKDCK